MTSFPETKVERYVKSGEYAGLFVEFSHKHISRVYPKGSRLDSSNYDPTPMWCAGSQLVSLNYQTPGVCVWGGGINIEVCHVLVEVWILQYLY